MVRVTGDVEVGLFSGEEILEDIILGSADR